MESKPHALAAGVFVLVAAALLIGLAMWLMRDSTDTVTYEMITDSAVTGLQPQAAVRFKGVDIGKVTDVSFDSEQRGNVLVRIAVMPDAPITRSTFATLTFQGVTGLSFVQLDDPGGSTDAPPSGSDGRPPRIPLRDGALGQLTDRANGLVDKIGQAADRISQLLSNENQTALTGTLKDIGATATTLNQLATHTDRMIQAQLGPGGADLPALTRQATRTLQSLEDVGVKVNAAMDEVSAAAANLRHGVDTLITQGGAIDRLGDSVATISATTLPRIQELTENASHAIRRFDRVVDSISENPQSLVYGAGPIPPGPGERGFKPESGR
ncbi:MAG: MlaD family protein [Burkholderiaceae bacterium]|jgi:phospholipid/cholesterol/gamma-HCH transport system substrate-binding protein|nr:MlaD family protein [Burkholderiaceae bacterium]